jgi:hypothetical protein
VELTIEEVAGRAGVDVAYARRLVDLGALGPEGDGYREQDAHVARCGARLEWVGERCRPAAHALRGDQGRAAGGSQRRACDRAQRRRCHGHTYPPQ